MAPTLATALWLAAARGAAPRAAWQGRFSGRNLPDGVRAAFDFRI